MNWIEKLRLRQARTGKPYHTLCRELGSAGGRAAARKKRERRAVLEAREIEKLRQVARGTEDRDAVPDAIFTNVDRANIAREAQTARLRLKALEARA